MNAMKTIHVLSVLLATALPAVFAVLAARARTEEEHLFAARIIRLLGYALFTPALALGLLTGVGVQHMSKIPTGSLWIAASLALWVVAMGLCHAVQLSAAKKLIATVREKGTGTAGPLAMRISVVGWTVTATLLVIGVLMVLQPGQLLF